VKGVLLYSEKKTFVCGEFLLLKDLVKKRFYQLELKKFKSAQFLPSNFLLGT